MVDINLFDESDTGKSKKWDDSDSGSNSLGSEDLDEDFAFDNKKATSKKEDPFQAEDTVPDWGENEDMGAIPAEPRKKKSSVGLLVVLGTLLIAATVFFLYIYPSMTKPKKSPKTATTTKTGPAVKPGETPVKPGSRLDSLRTAGRPGSIFTAVQAAQKVFLNLAEQGQLGVVIINAKQFMVQYVSETPGVANAMGQRIQTLLGVPKYASSPEDRHQTAGQTRYWGVISGQWLQPLTDPAAIGAVAFVNTDMLIARMKEEAQKKRLTYRDVQKFPTLREGGLQKSSARMIIEGEKPKVVEFLGSLQTIEGRWGLSKLLIAPLKIEDFYARQAKLDIEFWVAVP
jgi:hypothetical protein